MNNLIKLFFILSVLVILPCAAVNSIQQELGGAENFALFNLPTSPNPHMNSGTTTGNLGIAGSTQLSFDNPAILKGNVYLGDTAKLQNTGTINGSIFNNQDTEGIMLNQLVTNATNASSYFGGLTGTSISSITTSQTLNATSAENVFNVGSINLNNQTLTLNGTANQQFIFDITGNMNVQSGASIVLKGGLTPNDVLFNLSGNLSTSGPLVTINGVVLDVSGNVNMSEGLINGELIAGGKTTQVVSGSYITETDVPVPEPSTYILLGSLLLGVVFLKHKQSNV